MQLAHVLKFLPISINNCSRKTWKVFHFFDELLPIPNEEKIHLSGTDFTFHTGEVNQRLLCCCFYNVLRYYKHSKLGQYLRNTLKQDDLFLDVGANMGMYSYLAKSSGAKVVAFEPEPTHADFLIRNPQCYDRLHRFALSDAASTCTFYLGDKLNSGIHSLVLGNQSFEDSDYSKNIEVKTQRLDSIITDETDLNQLKLIKVDVEGAEEQVIRGSLGILEKGFRPQFWCEVRGEKSDRNGGNYTKIIHMLAQFGYKPHVLQNGEIKAFNAERHKKQVFDLLLIA